MIKKALLVISEWSKRKHKSPGHLGEVGMLLVGCLLAVKFYRTFLLSHLFHVSMQWQLKALETLYACTAAPKPLIVVLLN